MKTNLNASNELFCESAQVLPSSSEPLLTKLSFCSKFDEMQILDKTGSPLADELELNGVEIFCNAILSRYLEYERRLIFEMCLRMYTDSQKHESTLLHTYVLNEFLTADRSCTTKYF